MSTRFGHATLLHHVAPHWMPSVAQVTQGLREDNQRPTSELRNQAIALWPTLAVHEACRATLAEWATAQSETELGLTLQAALVAQARQATLADRPLPTAAHHRRPRA